MHTQFNPDFFRFAVSEQIQKVHGKADLYGDREKEVYSKANYDVSCWA